VTRLATDGFGKPNGRFLSVERK